MAPNFPWNLEEWFFLKTKVALCQKCTIFLIDVKLLWTNHYSESYVTRLVKKKEGERGRTEKSRQWIFSFHWFS